mmetsp:Transcript_29275/g.55280  ORF Transcript_29275/g.55280 Transcript_29275/m.55280 type:complete len:92 (-) Transcript_29275:61-336(-)
MFKPGGMYLKLVVLVDDDRTPLRSSPSPALLLTNTRLACILHSGPPPNLLLSVPGFFGLIVLKCMVDVYLISIRFFAVRLSPQTPHELRRA